jgi:hypothetical protein
MKHLLITIAIFSLVLSTPVMADQEQYDDCILGHLKGAKLDLATHLIRRACEENYKTSNFTSKKRIAYNNCLLEFLVEVESIQATMEIKAACGRKHD